MISMKRGIWFALAAVAGMTLMYAATKYIVRGSGPHVIAFGGKNHEDKNFNSFPIDSSTREFDDWLS
jgi:hypothetical protein